MTRYVCPSALNVAALPEGSEYRLRLAGGPPVEQCAFPCTFDHNEKVCFPRRCRLWQAKLSDAQIFFSTEERAFLRWWTGMWSVACCVATLFTVLTFLIDMPRFANIS